MKTIILALAILIPAIASAQEETVTWQWAVDSTGATQTINDITINETLPAAVTMRNNELLSSCSVTFAYTQAIYREHGDTFTLGTSERQIQAIKCNHDTNPYAVLEIDLYDVKHVEIIKTHK